MITIGRVHGQDLAIPGAVGLVLDIVRLTKPCHVFASWPCTSFFLLQSQRLAKDPTAIEALRGRGVLRKRCLDLFIRCWSEQVNAGRFCSGGNPWTSEAWKDLRFAKLQAHYARAHQCMVGLYHPDKSGKGHEKTFALSHPHKM